MQVPMNLARREWLLAAIALATVTVRPAAAQGLAGLSSGDATAGLRAALERGTGFAIDSLGKFDGYWNNPKVRIPLPAWIERGESALRLAGRGKDIDALKLGVNRAAEQAVPLARPIVVSAVREMSVQDAKAILTGGDDSVTRFFADKTRAPLTERFLPIVTEVTGKIGLAQQYNALAARGEQLGLVRGDDVRVERHVTTRALDGLYLLIAEEERRIRSDPVGTGSAILQKVFGTLR